MTFQDKKQKGRLTLFAGQHIRGKTRPDTLAMVKQEIILNVVMLHRNILIIAKRAPELPKNRAKSHGSESVAMVTYYFLPKISNTCYKPHTLENTPL